MTADRFGPHPAGEYTALSAARPTSTEPVVEPSGGSPAAASPRAPAATGWAKWRPSVPPQHGAWAFLIVPVLGGFAVAGTSWAGWLFLVTWLCAYPTGYYAGRALTARVRRGSWTRLARRERERAAPWAVATAVLGVPLAMTRPWLLGALVLLLALWGIGLVVGSRRGERSLENDLVLVGEAVLAIPVTIAVVAGPSALVGDLAGPTMACMAMLAVYLVGSVLHVKSVLREARSVRYRRVDVGWHAAALLAAGLVDPWWLVGFGPALVRAVLARPGLRPGVVGGIEAVVAVLVVVAAFLAF